ncbi:hypothetical protein [Clostridium botulinum]|uniref:hypothetical protein n=1 Tax=Clostridium botulinum TaxID=1491 RepID=UPI001650DB81|nr:hypothetical protein [Clostridium botulinum]QPW62175.1 hypothetical protein IG390_14800 [Clostridium botulinum]
MFKISNDTFFKICKIVSISCILISIVGWIPTFCSILTPLWMVSVLVSPIGFIFSLIILIKYNWKLGILLALLNVIMFFSFFIVMHIGYTFFYPHN